MKMKRYKCVPTAFAGLGAEMLVILLWAITVFGSGWCEWSKGIYLLFAIFYVGRLSMECDLVPSHVSLYVFVSGSSGLQVSLS